MRKTVKKVMLINPPGKVTVTITGSRERKLAVPPLGLAYLGAVLKAAGYEVEILDVLVEGYAHERVLGPSVVYGLPEDAIRQRIRAFNPDMIGVSCLFSNRGQDAERLCALAKDEIPDAHVVIGGQHPSGYPDVIQNEAIDYLMYGESEDSIIELLDAINSGGGLKKVSQLVFRDGDGVWRNPRMRRPDVALLPFPAWDLVNLKKYWEIGLADYELNAGDEKRFMVMLSSRGCPHACDFCTAPMMTERQYKYRTMGDLAREIHSYVDRYGTKEINFWDDNFFINKNRVKELLRFIAVEFPGLAFQVPSGAEVNCIDDEVIDLMAKAGWKKLFMAVESPNEEIQFDHIDKKVKLSRVRGIVAKLREVGIISEGSFMVGFPHETKAQIDSAFAKIPEFGFDRISISIVNPLPGTALYDRCAAEGLLHDDFDPKNIMWSRENIKLEGVERGYIEEKRREVWLNYMKSRIDIEKYQTLNLDKSLLSQFSFPHTEASASTPN